MTSADTDVRARLSWMWVFVMLNMIVADIFGFMIPGALKQIMEGQAEQITITPEFLLLAAVADPDSDRDGRALPGAAQAPEPLGQPDCQHLHDRVRLEPGYGCPPLRLHCGSRDSRLPLHRLVRVEMA